MKSAKFPVRSRHNVRITPRTPRYGPLSLNLRPRARRSIPDRGSSAHVTLQRRVVPSVTPFWNLLRLCLLSWWSPGLPCAEILRLVYSFSASSLCLEGEPYLQGRNAGGPTVAGGLLNGLGGDPPRCQGPSSRPPTSATAVAHGQHGPPGERRGREMGDWDTERKQLGKGTKSGRIFTECDTKPKG
jgi:hypothetical protein